VICEFAAAWNARDGASRRRLLERSWNAAGRFADPMIRLDDRESLLAYIGRCHDTAPEARYVVLSIDAHHRQACVAWALQHPDGRPGLVGRSVGELDETGRLRSLVSFTVPQAERTVTA
jgi:hypothetical protein